MHKHYKSLSSPCISCASVDCHHLRYVHDPVRTTYLDLSQWIVEENINTLSLLTCFTAFRVARDLPEITKIEKLEPRLTLLIHCPEDLK